MLRKILGALSLIALTVLVGCSNDETGPGGDASLASFSPNQVSLGQENVVGHLNGTNLTGVTSIDLGAGITVHSFNPVSASQIDVTFSVSGTTGPGARTITVVLAGKTLTSSSIFNILDNRAPRAGFTVDPPAGSLATVFRFDASSSSDNDGRVAEYSWDFGDGRTATGKNVTHKYNSIGNYSARLTISDNDQATDIVTKNIDVKRNAPPEAKFKVSPEDGSNLDTYKFDASQSRDIDGTIRNFRWKFGDGKSDEGQVVEHAYEKGGNYTVELIVTDNNNQEAKVEKEIKVKQQTGRVCPSRPPNVFEAYRGVVEAWDPATKTVTIQFLGNPGCSAYYRCGDIRKGGLRGWGEMFPEKWIGVMCDFVDLGNGKAKIKVVLGNYAPPIGEKVYTWPQKDCTTAVCRR